MGFSVWHNKCGKMMNDIWVPVFDLVNTILTKVIKLSRLHTKSLVNVVFWLPFVIAAFLEVFPTYVWYFMRPKITIIVWRKSIFKDGRHITKDEQKYRSRNWRKICLTYYNKSLKSRYQIVNSEHLKLELSWIDWRIWTPFEIHIRTRKR